MPGPVVPGPVVTPTGFSELVERARRARDLGHPGADALWAEVAVRVDAQPEADPLVRADLADQQALAAARRGAEEAPALLTAVRDDYRALGRAERAALAELRLASVAAQSGAAPAEIRERLRAAVRAAEGLDAAEPLRARRIALAELSAIRVESYLRSVEAAGSDDHRHDHHHDHHDPDQEHGHGELAAELTAFIAAYADTAADLVAEAEEMLGRVALAQGDPERAVALLAASAERAVSAGRPWQAVDPLVLRAGVLMSLDRPEEAEEAARSGLEHAAELTDAEAQGVVRLTLADILLRRVPRRRPLSTRWREPTGSTRPVSPPTAERRRGSCWPGRTRRTAGRPRRRRFCSRLCRICWSTATSRRCSYGSSWAICCAG